MFCGACGALLQDRPPPGRDGSSTPAGPGWWRSTTTGVVVAVVLVGVVATVPTLSIDRPDPVDTSIDVPDTDDLRAAPAGTTTRPRVDPPEIACSREDVEVECISWSRPMTAPMDRQDGWGSAWVFGVPGGIVVAEAERAELIDSRTGTRLWSVDVPEHAFPGAHDERSLVFEGPTTTTVIDLEDGGTRWSVRTDRPVGGDLVQGDVIFTGTDDDLPSGVAARDAHDGSVLWAWPTSWSGVQLQQIGPGHLLAHSHDGDRAVVLDTATGEVSAQVDDLAYGWVLHVVDDTAVVVQQIIDWVPSDTNAAGDRGALLVGIDVTNGATVWEQQVRAAEASFGVVGDLVLAPSSRHLTALDARTGELVWEVPTTSSELVAFQAGQFPLAFDVAPAADHLVTLDQRAGVLRARAPASGEVLWERAVPEASWHATVHGDEVVVFGPNEHRLLTTATGAERLRVTARDAQLVTHDPLVLYDHTSGYVTRLDVPARTP